MLYCEFRIAMLRFVFYCCCQRLTFFNRIYDETFFRKKCIIYGHCHHDSEHVLHGCVSYAVVITEIKLKQNKRKTMFCFSEIVLFQRVYM